MYYSGGFHSPKKIKDMNTFECHYCKEGEQREILFVGSLIFANFERVFQQKSPISMVGNGQLKVDKLLHQIEGVVAQWCNPLTLKPKQSGGVGSIPGRTPPLERHEKGSQT